MPATSDIATFANTITVDQWLALPSDYHRHIVTAYCTNEFRQLLAQKVPVNHLNINKASVLLELGKIGVMALANKNFKAGEEVFSLCGPMLSEPNIFSVQVDHNMHMVPSGGGAEFLAHSCRPTVKLVIEKHSVEPVDTPKLPFDAATSLANLIETQPFPAWFFDADGAGHAETEKDEIPFKFQENYTMHVVALRDIAKGEVLCFNYLTTEYAMDQCFECQCYKISEAPKGASELPNCFGTIHGYKHLPQHLKDALKPICTSVVLESEEHAKKN